MRNLPAVVALALALSPPLLAQNPNDSPGFDFSQLDRSADPCVDFYQFACGGWRARHPLPDDKPRWGRYDEMAERNREKLRAILENAARPAADRTPLERQVGEYYAACMDTSAADRRGAAPLAPYLERIARLATPADVLRELAALHAEGVSAFFQFGAQPDLRDANQVLANLDQGGLGLPDRDHYLKTDAKNVERRATYREHVRRMFELAGEPASEASAAADRVLRVETALAEASMDRVARRDPHNLDHRVGRDALPSPAPDVSFEPYFAATGAPAFRELNDANPAFVATVARLIGSAPLVDLRAYLSWRVIRWAAPRLSTPFDDEAFRFNEQYLRGTKAKEARWKTCVRNVDRDLGEASGRLFVERYFGAQGKAKMREIVTNILAALEESLRRVDWMSEPTRDKALAKLAKIRTTKLGFPETYRDYSSVRVAADDFLGNAARAARFESARTWAKIGRPLDRGEWGMTPPTVNAYYDPQAAEIVFPAGMLQPPMFDLAADEAYTYGAIGRVIGHELTHGFDDEGRKFDADGNLADWWTEADAKAFEERAACIERQYGEYSPVDDAAGAPIFLNGKLTLGENTADNGGVRMAYLAYRKSRGGAPGAVIDGWTPEQRFFVGYGVSRCENVADEQARILVDTDPHAPGKFRLIGAVSNMPEFWEAFSCRPGQPMVRGDKACRVW